MLCESEPAIVEEDPSRAEQFPEVTSIEDNHGLELENDHPPRDDGNVQPEPVCNVPPQTRSRTRIASLRYPSPDFPSDFEDGCLLYDSDFYGVPMSSGKDLGDSSNQATVSSRDKPNPRTVIHTSRTATFRAPKDGTTAPPKGKASGGRPASRTHGPSTAAAHAAAMLDVWPPLSAPGATILARRRIAQLDHAPGPPSRLGRPSPRHVNHYVFTPAGSSAAGGGATLYVFYDGFD
jgi:hypothetical protein